MSVVTVFVCPAGSVGVTSSLIGGADVPSCASGQGSWQSVLVAEPFDPAMLSQPELAGAFSAGFVLMGTGLVIVWAAKQVLRAVRSAL